MALIACKACGKEISGEAKACPHCGQPNQAKRMGCAAILGIGAAGMIVLMIIGSIAGGPSHDGPDKSSVLDDAAFLKDNPGFTDGVRKLIQAEGYECPALAQLWNKGTTPRGLELEALCGPDDGRRNSFSKLHYAVFPKTARVELCKEFGILGGGCD